MKIKQALYKAAVILLMLFTLNGCWDQRIFEKVGFILNLGIDKAGDDIMLTYTTPVIQEKEEVDVSVITCSIVREGREFGRLAAPRRVEGGKLQNIFIGESIAKEGILNHLEILERNISNPTQSWLLIVDGSASEFITKGGKLEGKPRLAFYLNQLMESNTESGYCPASTVIRYSIEEGIPGLDPIVPIVKIDKGAVRISGTALMDRDRMTGQIDYQETAYLMLASGRNKKSIFFFELNEELAGDKDKIAVSNRKSSVKSEISLVNDLPKISFKIDIKLILEEYMWNNLADKNKELQIEKFLDKNFRTRLDEMFKKLLAANCDAIGIGDKVRAKYNDYWMKIGEESGWKKIYPNMSAEFNVKTDIIRYGVIQ